MNNTHYMNKNEYEKRLAKQSNAKRHRKRRKRKLTFISVLLVFVALSVCLIVCSVLFFKIDTINILTADLTEEENVLNACDIKKGENIFTIDEKKSEEKILSTILNADSVIVDKKYPTEIKIELIKAEIKYAIKQGDEYLMLSTNGRVVDKQSQKPNDLILIKGIKTNLSIGDFLIDNKQYESVTLAHETFIDYNLDKISIIDISDEYNINIFYDNRIRIIVGNSINLNYKVKVIKQAYEKEFTNENYGVIDGSVERNAYVRKGRDYINFFDEPSIDSSSDLSS